MGRGCAALVGAAVFASIALPIVSKLSQPHRLKGTMSASTP
jgi:hypothetical protein